MCEVFVLNTSLHSYCSIRANYCYSKKILHPDTLLKRNSGELSNGLSLEVLHEFIFLLFSFSHFLYVSK